MNRPETFAEQYVKDNKLPTKFASIIASQIRTQLNNYLSKRLDGFLKVYDPKLTYTEGADPQEDKKRINNGRY